MYSTLYLNPDHLEVVHGYPPNVNNNLNKDTYQAITWYFLVHMWGQRTTYPGDSHGVFGRFRKHNAMSNRDVIRHTDRGELGREECLRRIALLAFTSKALS